MDFEQQLESLRDEKQRLEDEISHLEEELSETSSSTESLREDLESLTESLETGRVPASERDEREAVTEIEPIEIGEGRERPPRGARSEQIWQAVQVISREKEKFKAADLFELLKEADPDFEEDQRAYLYTKLNDFRDEGKLEKVKRGTWRLTD